MKTDNNEPSLKKRNDIFEPLTFKLKETRKNVQSKIEKKSKNKSTRLFKNVLKGIENLNIGEKEKVIFKPLDKRILQTDSKPNQEFNQLIKFLAQNESIAAAIFPDKEVRLYYLNPDNFISPEKYWLGFFQYLTLAEKKSGNAPIMLLADDGYLSNLYAVLPSTQKPHLLKFMSKKFGNFTPLYRLVCFGHFTDFANGISKKHQSTLIESLATNGCNDYTTLLLLAERYHVDLITFFEQLDSGLYNRFKVLLYKCDAVTVLRDKINGYQPKQITKKEELFNMLKMLDLHHFL